MTDSFRISIMINEKKNIVFRMEYRYKKTLKESMLRIDAHATANRVSSKEVLGL